MNHLQFTPDEERSITLFASLPTEAGKHIHSWIAEIVPAVGLLAYGLWSERQAFTIAGFVPVVIFSTLRMYRQFKHSKVIKSIFMKVQAYQSNAIGAQPCAHPNAGNSADCAD